MSYTKTTWQDGITPLSAQKMNNLENQYDAVKEELGNRDGELWAQIKAADGVGSGLDADKLKGKNMDGFYFYDVKDNIIFSRENSVRIETVEFSLAKTITLPISSMHEYSNGQGPLPISRRVKASKVKISAYTEGSAVDGWVYVSYQVNGGTEISLPIHGPFSSLHVYYEDNINLDTMTEGEITFRVYLKSDSTAYWANSPLFEVTGSMLCRGLAE